MTPDMKRLCDAMRVVFDAHYDGDATLDDDGAEALVYAVLTELKEPQEHFVEICEEKDIDVGCGCGNNLCAGWRANDIIEAVVGHILAEPAKA